MQGPPEIVHLFCDFPANTLWPESHHQEIIDKPQLKDIYKITGSVKVKSNMDTEEMFRFKETKDARKLNANGDPGKEQERKL